MNKSINVLLFSIISCMLSYNYLYSAQIDDLSSVTQVNSLEQCQQCIKENPIVIVYFYHNRCNGCKKTAPIIELTAMTHNESYRFLKINTDDIPEAANIYELRCVPTIIFFKNGIEIDRKNTISLADFQQAISSLKEIL